MSKLVGKTAVITGGGSGIGLATAKRFIEDGAFVYIFGRRREALDEALRQLGPNARAVSGSVTEAADLDQLFAMVKAERGGLDILVANAAAADVASLGAITPEQYDRTFDVNVKGVLFTVQQGLPLMKDGSSIVIIGSAASVKGTPALSLYSASKAAIRSFARTWSQDLRGTGIRVNILSPGAIRTDAAMAMMGEDGVAALANAAPLGRVGEPSEIAAVAAFLASSDSSFMTGSEISADGGAAQV